MSLYSSLQGTGAGRGGRERVKVGYSELAGVLFVSVKIMV